MRIIIRVIGIIALSATAIAWTGVGPALAGCGYAGQPVQFGGVSGDPEKDTFGLLCSGDVAQAGSATKAARAEIMQVGANTGDPEKDSFGLVQVASAP
jgi:hypothetical protein